MTVHVRKSCTPRISRSHASRHDLRYSKYASIWPCCGFESFPRAAVSTRSRRLALCLHATDFSESLTDPCVQKQANAGAFLQIWLTKFSETIQGVLRLVLVAAALVASLALVRTLSSHVWAYSVQNSMKFASITAFQPQTVDQFNRWALYKMQKVRLNYGLAHEHVHFRTPVIVSTDKGPW